MQSCDRIAKLGLSRGGVDRVRGVEISPGRGSSARTEILIGYLALGSRQGQGEGVRAQ